ncbi:hypothetical protein AB0C76_23055 [Kitasatospora sp. NPDC048722]|uniref:hypothetical protein n=1 Tax=Kitasatospora sp. NPDC048722 TaxID=3155639 RepID=UPI0033E2CBB0
MLVIEPVFESTGGRAALRPVVPTAAPTEATAAERGLLPVVPALRDLLPEGGLRRGTAVSVAGGDTGLLLALAAGAKDIGGGWAAAVGLPDLGLAAAEGYGLDLRRLLVADDPGPHWAEVVSVLAGAVELVMLRPDGPVPPRLAARLAAVLRRSGCVLLVAGPWPGAALRLGVRSGRWFGLGDGYGQLAGRQVEVVAEGRGSATPGRTARLWLPDEHGAARPVGEPAGAVGETDAFESGAPDASGEVHPLGEAAGTVVETETFGRVRRLPGASGAAGAVHPLGEAHPLGAGVEAVAEFGARVRRRPAEPVAARQAVRAAQAAHSAEVGEATERVAVV